MILNPEGLDVALRLPLFLQPASPQFSATVIPFRLQALMCAAVN